MVPVYFGSLDPANREGLFTIGKKNLHISGTTQFKFLWLKDQLIRQKKTASVNMSKILLSVRTNTLEFRKY